MQCSILPLFITCVLCLLSFCTTQKDQTSIPGITPADVYDKMPERGFLLSETWSAKLYQTSLTAYMGGIDFDVVIYGPDADEVDSVRVEMQADSTLADVQDVEIILHQVAQAPYDDSRPGTATQWITDNYHKLHSTTVIGPVEYTLWAPSKYYRRMTMKRAAQLLVFGVAVQ